MADTPRFSVTIPAFNAEATLAETIASVQAQTFGDFEVVVCDDGSTDGTLALAHSLAAEDPRVRVVAQENRGSGGAYNTAVRAARSDLLVMLSADDLLLPEHLASFDSFVRENPDVSVFTCNGYYEYEDGRREPSSFHLGWRDRSSCDLVDLLSACFYNVGVVYRRAVFDAVGGFREDIYAEDYLFFLLALAHGFRHRFLDVPLSVHRRNSLQKSADGLRMREADLWAVRHLMSTGLLTPPQRAAAKASAARLRRNIRTRRLLMGLLGADLSSRLITRVRRLRSGASS